MAWSTEEISQLDLKLCREVLAEEQAKLFDSLDSTVTPNVGTGVEELNRCWVEGVADRWSMLRRYLEIFGASKNTAPSNIVVDPIASMEVHKGVYRQAFIRRLQRNGITYIVQTLRRGLMQSPKWDEARIFQDRQLRGNSSSVPSVSDTTSDTPEKYVYVEFFGIDPDKETVFVAGLTADTYTAPVAGGQTLSGEWHNLGLTLEPADDGTLTARLLLARPQYTLKAFSDIGGTNESDVFYLWNVPKTIAQQILDDFRDLAIPGSSSSASYNTDQGVVDIVLRKKASEEDEINFGTIGRACSYEETATVTYNVAEPEDVQIPADALTMAENVGVTFRREVQNNGDGTFNITIIRRERITQGPLTFNAEASFGRNISAKETRGWKTGYAAYAASYPQVNPPAGTTYTRDVQINEDCSLDIVDREIVVSPLPRKSKRSTFLASSESNGKINATEAEANAADGINPQIGETVIFDEQQNPDGSWTYDLRIDKSPELQGRRVVIRGTKGIAVDTNTDQNLRADPAPEPENPLPAAGVTVNFELRRNADGTYDRTETEEIATPLDQETERRAVTKAGTFIDTSVGARNVTSEPEPTESPSPGRTVEFEKRENPDGSWDKNERVNVRPQTEGAQYRITPTEGATEAETDSGATSEPHTILPTPAQGEIIVIDKRENPDGSWEASKRTDVSPILENYESTATPLQSSEGSGIENKRDPMPEPTAPSLGETVRFRRRKNEDGTWTYSEIIERSSDAPLRAILHEVTACRELSVTEIERNLAQDLSAYDPGTPPEGTTRVVRLTENRDGSWDREIIDRAAPALEAERSIQRGEKSETESETYRNSAPGSHPRPVAGPRQRVTFDRQENVDCSEDVTITTEEIPTLVAGEAVARSDQVFTAEIERNADDPITLETTPVAGQIISTSKEETDDGLWNNKRTVAKAVSFSETFYYNADGRSVTITIFTNLTKIEVDAIVALSNPDYLNTLSVRDSGFPERYSGSFVSEAPTNSGGSTSGGVDYYNDTYSLVLLNDSNEPQTYKIRIILASTPARASVAFTDKPHEGAKLNTFKRFGQLVNIPVGLAFLGRRTWRGIGVWV